MTQSTAEIIAAERAKVAAVQSEIETPTVGANIFPVEFSTYAAQMITTLAEEIETAGTPADAAKWQARLDVWQEAADGSQPTASQIRAAQKKAAQA